MPSKMLLIGSIRLPVLKLGKHRSASIAIMCNSFWHTGLQRLQLLSWHTIMVALAHGMIKISFPKGIQLRIAKNSNFRQRLTVPPDMMTEAKHKQKHLCGVERHNYCTLMGILPSASDSCSPEA